MFRGQIVDPQTRRVPKRRDEIEIELYRAHDDVANVGGTIIIRRIAGGTFDNPNRPGARTSAERDPTTAGDLIPSGKPRAAAR